MIKADKRKKIKIQINKVQLPRFLQFNGETHQIKTQKYLSNHLKIIGNKWNNPLRSSKKQFKFYHMYNKKAIPILQKMKELTQIDANKRLSIRKTIQLHDKILQREVLKQSKEKRISLQIQSGQAIENEAQQIIQTFQGGVLPENYLRQDQKFKQKNKNKINSWNSMHDRNKKYLEMIISEKVISGDQKAVKNIQKRIFKEVLAKKRDDQQKKKRIKEQRNTFLRQHKRNFEWERSLGLVPRPKTAMAIIPLNSGEELNIQQYYQKPSKGRKTQSAIQFPVKYPQKSRIKKPKRISTQKPCKKLYHYKKSKDVNPYAHSEFNGLIIRNVDENSLRNNSKYSNRVYNMSTTVRKNVASSNISRPCTVDGQNQQRSKFRLMNSNLSSRRQIRSAYDAKFFRSKSTNQFGFKNTQKKIKLTNNREMYNEKVTIYLFSVHNLSKKQIYNEMDNFDMQLQLKTPFFKGFSKTDLKMNKKQLQPKGYKTQEEIHDKLRKKKTKCHDRNSILKVYDTETED